MCFFEKTCQLPHFVFAQHAQKKERKLVKLYRMSMVKRIIC